MVNNVVVNTQLSTRLATLMKQNNVLQEQATDEQNTKASKEDLEELQRELRSEQEQHESQVESLQMEVQELKRRDSALLDQNKGRSDSCLMVGVAARYMACYHSLQIWRRG